MSEVSATAPRAAQPMDSTAGAKPRGGARVLCFVLQIFFMAVALVLFFLFAGIAAVVLLHLCIVGRAFRCRRGGGVGFGTGFASDAPDSALPLPGLSTVQLKGLPAFEYSGGSSPEPSRSLECAVCLEVVKVGERCRALPPCGHAFHAICVDRWLVRSPGCPICRARVGAATPELADGRPIVWV